MGGQGLCATAPQSNYGRVEGCYVQPVELTDTEKAIYLKLVELAKAGKIEWVGANFGKFGDYQVEFYGSSIAISLRRNDEHRDYIADIPAIGEQITGDLAKIAGEQYKARKKTLQDTFLQS